MTSETSIRTIALVRAELLGLVTPDFYYTADELKAMPDADLQKLFKDLKPEDVLAMKKDDAALNKASTQLKEGVAFGELWYAMGNLPALGDGQVRAGQRGDRRAVVRLGARAEDQAIGPEVLDDQLDGPEGMQP